MCCSVHYWQFVIYHHRFCFFFCWKGKEVKNTQPMWEQSFFILYVYYSWGFTGSSADAHKVSCKKFSVQNSVLYFCQNSIHQAWFAKCFFIFLLHTSFHFQHDTHTGEVHTLFVRLVKNETVSCSAGFQSLFWSAPPNSPHAVTHNNFPYQPEPRPCAECWQETVFLTKPSVLSCRVRCVLVKIDFVIFTGVFINECVRKKKQQLPYLLFM